MRWSKLLVLVGLLTPFFMIGAVTAQASHVVNANARAVLADQTTTATTPTTTLQDRIKAAETTYMVKLTSLQQARIKTRCKAAQGLVSSISGRVNGMETSRNEVYDNLVNRLNDLTGRLKNQGIDVTDLNTEISTLQTKIVTFKTDLATYKQTIADLQAVDCANDPTAFQAVLSAARAAHDKVAADEKDIFSYLTNTIKPTLVKIQSSLSTTNSQSKQD